MFDGLESISWRKLRHAYGPADDAPRWIRALNSEVEDDRTEAINHFLWSSVFHQYTVYTATPFVIPFVVEALESATLAERDDGMGHPMKRELIHFIRLCAESGQRSVQGWEAWPAPRGSTIEEAVRAGRRIYASYSDDAESRVRTDAAWLLNFCDAHSNDS